MVNQKISEIAQKLWDADVNRFKPNVDYELDLQKTASTGKKFEAEDHCSRSLFKTIDEKKLFSLPTYSKFMALLDNYKLETRQQEVLTTHELNEESEFVDALLETDVIRIAAKFLIDEGKINNVSELKPLLVDLWFTFYSRTASSNIRDSSAFEHVFVGEIKQGHGHDQHGYGTGTVLGCHSWIQYYLLEKANKTNYFGYCPNDCVYNGDDVFILGMQFLQSGELKTLGGFMIGSSPEFEIALYTIIFLCCGQKTKLEFAGMKFAINCFKMERDNDVVMATLFTSKN